MSYSNTPQNAVSSNGIGVVPDALLNAFTQSDATAAQLRGFIGIVGMTVTLQGLTAAGDGGAGIFYWATGSFTDDGQSTIVPSGAAGQGAWLRAPMFYGAPKYTVSALPSVTSANQGALAYATNGLNNGESSGSGTGCLVTVNKNAIWAAVWSGLEVMA